MKDDQLQAISAAVLRITLGIVLIAHSLYLKLMVFTLPGTAQFFESIGLPGLLAYVTFAVELIAGVFLIIGYQVRIAAMAVLPFLLGATWAHFGNGWLFTNEGGGWEYPLVLAVVAIAQALLGGGYGALSDITTNRTKYSMAKA